MKLKANVGCSSVHDHVDIETAKIRYAVAMGVDYVSEISLVPRLKRAVFDAVTDLPRARTRLCTVPLYDALLEGRDPLSVMREWYDRGVGAFTLHLTPSRMLRRAIDDGFRVNSRAGYFLAGEAAAGRENPHFASWAEIASFLRETDCELFVGTSLRPGSVAESRRSGLWMDEIRFVRDFLGEQGLCSDDYVLECGGHVDARGLDEFADLVRGLKVCVMGPLLTDATNGFDDLSSIIGATAFAARTPIHTHLILTRDEHLRLPSLESFQKAVQSAVVLRHNADLLTGDAAAGAVEAGFQNRSARCTLGVNLFGAIGDRQAECTMCGAHCPLEPIQSQGEVRE